MRFEKLSCVSRDSRVSAAFSDMFFFTLLARSLSEELSYKPTQKLANAPKTKKTKIQNGKNGPKILHNQVPQVHGAISA